jgi:PilZ domain
MSSTNQPESDNAAVATANERRRNLRFPFSAAVETIETKSGIKVIGRTSDLGLGGCYVDTLSPLPLGTVAKIRIVRGKEIFEAQVKVVYSTIGMGMGLVFVSAHPKQVRLFQKWVLEISGKSIPTDDASGQDVLETTPVEHSQTLKNVVLTDLIMTLMQKNVLTDIEGKDLLRKLFR